MTTLFHPRLLFSLMGVFLSTTQAAADDPLPLQLDHAFENTNLLIYETRGVWQDTNRLRLLGTASHLDYSSLELFVSADFTAEISEVESSLDTDFSLYRLTMSYQGDRTLIIAGRQRIPFGVGRLWNPIDIFNPIDATAIEPDEREGTDALRLEYSLSDLAIIDGTVAEKQVAMRAKGYLTHADTALVTLYDEQRELFIVGWELEGELLGSGLELRSEGGFFEDREREQEYFSFIVGGEYGLPNSLNLLTEFYYDGAREQIEAGVTLTYQLNMLTQLSLLAIANLDDGSYFLSPGINYSLSDEMTLSFTALLYEGDELSTYGQGDDLFVLNWFAHF